MGIVSVQQLIDRIQSDLSDWDSKTKPWFRGESREVPPRPSLCPKISDYEFWEENYLLQSFRRQAGGLSDVPPRDETDLWLFLAQHYGVPTRLLDWTESALHALYFAINQGNPDPRVYMLNPRKLNEVAGAPTYDFNYPLSFHGIGAIYVQLAWTNRNLGAVVVTADFFYRTCDLREVENRQKAIEKRLEVPIAFPATYQDRRMNAQRSSFTIHGSSLKPIQEILKSKRDDSRDILIEYQIDSNVSAKLLKDLSVLGVSASTVFPDLEHLARDLVYDIKTFPTTPPVLQHGMPAAGTGEFFEPVRFPGIDAVEPLAQPHDDGEANPDVGSPAT